MALNRQQVMLVVLALVAVWALWLTMGGEGPMVGGAGRPAPPRGVPGDLPPVIRLTDLENPVAAFNPSGGRNLFAYAEPRRAAPPVPQARAHQPPPKPQPVPVAPKPVVAPPPPPQKVAATQPTPPVVNFEFVGYLGPQNALIGVFKVNTPDGEEVVLAAVGETLADHFRVHRIGYEEVEIGYTQEPFLKERKVLTMGAQS